MIEFGTKLNTKQTLNYSLKELLALFTDIKEKEEYYKILAQRQTYTFNESTTKERGCIEDEKVLFNPTLDKIKQDRGLEVDRNKYHDLAHKIS